jgi:nucleotide-binding universal stress UspA family protein
MTIVVGCTTKPEGRAALRRAIAEAQAHGEDLVALNVSSGESYADPKVATEDELDEVRSALAEAGVDGEVRQLVRGKAAADELLSVADDLSASLVVIGLRRRTPVGKFVLGSVSQEVLLNAAMPVLAVKA